VGSAYKTLASKRENVAIAVYRSARPLQAGAREHIGLSCIHMQYIDCLLISMHAVLLASKKPSWLQGKEETSPPLFSALPTIASRQTEHSKHVGLSCTMTYALYGLPS
jgi:hypothetical protein